MASRNAKKHEQTQWEIKFFEVRRSPDALKTINPFRLNTVSAKGYAGKRNSLEQKQNRNNTDEDLF